MSGQRGSLGLSIAGGKGSLPYKNHDEVSAAAEKPAHVFDVLSDRWLNIHLELFFKKML